MKRSTRVIALVLVGVLLLSFVATILSAIV